MKFNSRDIDMLHGSLWDKIILFALPFALKGVMQQFLNAADVFTLGCKYDFCFICSGGNFFLSARRIFGCADFLFARNAAKRY